MSIQDDMILKHFQDHGKVVQANVISSNLTGGTSGADPCPRSHHDPEYFVLVDYSFTIAGDFQCRVLKQIRILESDFICPKSTNLNPNGCSGDYIIENAEKEKGDNCSFKQCLNFTLEELSSR